MANSVCVGLEPNINDRTTTIPKIQPAIKNPTKKSNAYYRSSLPPPRSKVPILNPTPSNQISRTPKRRLLIRSIPQPLEQARRTRPALPLPTAHLADRLLDHASLERVPECLDAVFHLEETGAAAVGRRGALRRGELEAPIFRHQRAGVEDVAIRGTGRGEGAIGGRGAG